MFGYQNKLRNANYNLMNSRLGYTDRQDPISNPLVPKEAIDENDEYTKGVILDSTVEAIPHMYSRLMAHGGIAQQERMIYDKRRAFEKALLFSYQGANIYRDGEQKIIRALINPNKLKMDYDDKIVSVGYEYNFAPGDVFLWEGTNTHWLIYLQDLEELAYFRGNIRKCSYEVQWEDEDGIHSSWIALRGPVETRINYIQKHQISLDKPNYSLNIIMPRTDSAVKYFKRYACFYLKDMDTCWRVEAVDAITTPGVMEVTAVEYYANTIEDDIENGLVGVLKTKQENPNPEEAERVIIGDTFIKPHTVYTYKFKGLSGSSWKIDTKKYPVQYTVNPNDDREIHLIWDSNYSGQFDISYGQASKTLIAESLF